MVYAPFDNAGTQDTWRTMFLTEASCHFIGGESLDNDGGILMFTQKSTLPEPKRDEIVWAVLEQVSLLNDLADATTTFLRCSPICFVLDYPRTTQLK